MSEGGRGTGGNQRAVKTIALTGYLELGRQKETQFSVEATWHITMKGERNWNTI
jgi:hypothetical protein